MAINTQERLWSDLAIPPGELIQEELDLIGMTQQELANRAGRPAQAINEMIHGKKIITHETAIQLEMVLGVPAHVWVNLESSYRMTLAKNNERNLLNEQEDWLDKFPIRAMEQRGWIPRHSDKVDTVRSLLRFLGIASFDESWSEAVIGFRITGDGNISREALAVWLRKGELEGHQVQTEPYNEAVFKKALIELRALTDTDPKEFVPVMQQRCAAAGVAVVYVPELPKSGANGAAKWLGGEKALIQLSLRWRWADVLWFSFFHEACHVLKHNIRKVYVEGIDESDPRAEEEADAFACDLLIPPNDWSQFIARGDRSLAATMNFASDMGVAPGIVVGRMHHEHIIPYNRFTNLQKRFAWGKP